MFQSYLRENKIITGGRGTKEPGREREEEGKNGDRIRCGRRQGRSTEGQEIEQMCVAVRDGELGKAIRKSQMPGKQEAPRIQWG